MKYAIQQQDKPGPGNLNGDDWYGGGHNYTLQQAVAQIDEWNSFESNRRDFNFRVIDENNNVIVAPTSGNAVAVDSKIAFAAKKVPLEMIPLVELQGAARVSQYGGKKHGKGNYRKASLSDGAGERYMGALFRHTGDMQNPDGTWDAKSLSARDEESGLPHIDHAIRTLTMLRGILIKDGALPADPGEGKEPPPSPK